ITTLWNRQSFGVNVHIASASTAAIAKRRDRFLFPGLMHAEHVTASGLMRAEPATASLSDTGWCIAECYCGWACNVDASFLSNLNRVGTGICIHDELGQFVLAKTEWMAFLCGVDVGEPLGEYMSLNIPKLMV
ncbi:cytochrome P450, partial [Trifolium medium]|nr:cytochrome P450 [Trifolium medium]